MARSVASRLLRRNQWLPGRTAELMARRRSDPDAL